MSRPPALKPDPRVAHCPDNDCQLRQTEALESIAAFLIRAEPSLKSMGQVFSRWESMCVWVRGKAPKHWWWVVLALWSATNFVSPELKDAITRAATMALNSYSAGGGA